MEHQVELTAESLWGEVSSRLQGALNDTTYRTWFADVEGEELSDDAFVLAVPNDFAREWIGDRPNSSTGVSMTTVNA